MMDKALRHKGFRESVPKALAYMARAEA